jgi:hypothetical protein
MRDAKSQVGYFVFSLDTELAWGYFDHDKARARLFSRDGARERRSIRLLLDILDEFDIRATWAVVGHLFYDRCEECEVCPILDWDGKYKSFGEVYETAKPLWYGADIIDTLLTRGAKHEIGFHGYTHRVFDENMMSAEEARVEIQEWLRVARRKNVIPQTVIFPRNRIGHLGVFREVGFVCYRGDKVMPRISSVPLVGKLLNRIDLSLQIFIPQVYELRVEPSGLVNIPASQGFLKVDRSIETILDSLNLHNLRIRRMIKGIENAAKEKKVVHIWAHPFEFRTKKDFEKLRYLFSYVAEQVDRGRLQSITMADLAGIALEQLGRAPQEDVLPGRVAVRQEQGGEPSSG